MWCHLAHTCLFAIPCLLGQVSVQTFCAFKIRLFGSNSLLRVLGLLWLPVLHQTRAHGDLSSSVPCAFALFSLFFFKTCLFIWDRESTSGRGEGEGERLSSRVRAERGATHGAPSTTGRSRPEPKSRVGRGTDTTQTPPTFIFLTGSLREQVFLISTMSDRPAFLVWFVLFRCCGREIRAYRRETMSSIPGDILCSETLFGVHIITGPFFDVFAGLSRCFTSSHSRVSL